MNSVVVAGLVVALAAGIASADDGKETDAEKIRGTWKVVSAKATTGFEDNIDVAQYMNSVWTFAEKDFTIRKDKGQDESRLRPRPEDEAEADRLRQGLGGEG